MRLRQRAIDLIAEMEKVDRVTPATYRCLESITVPQDYDVICSHMDPALGRPTAARLRVTTAQVLRDRNWKFVLLHPQLKGTHVHASRRMLRPPILCCGCVCLGHAHVGVTLERVRAWIVGNVGAWPP